MDTSNNLDPGHNPYQSTAIDDLSNQSGEMEVELASPWERIGAAIINSILAAIVGFFCFLAFIPVFRTPSQIGIVRATAVGSIISILLLLGLCIWQAVWMSKRGQSVGKRLMGIKVIGLEGQNPGFVGTVLMREIVFNVIVGVIILIIGAVSGAGYSAKSGASLVDLISNLPSLICLIMLFRPQTMRRTLQDYLAKTVVIKV